jgi:N utilization substance protein B
MTDNETSDAATEAEQKRRPADKRSAARMFVVQALYQLEIGGEDAIDVVSEFRTHRLGGDGDAASDADEAFFENLVYGVVKNQGAVDQQIAERLADGWRLGRLDSILRAVLRAGSFELQERKDVPARVIIDEYLNVAHAFFSGGEPAMVNGLLDKMAREFRPQEFA